MVSRRFSFFLPTSEFVLLVGMVVLDGLSVNTCNSIK